MAGLLETDPTNTAWQRDLSLAHNKVGLVLQAQGDGPGALAAFRKAMKVAKRLAAHDPENANWQVFLSATHIALAIAGDQPESRLRLAIDILRKLDRDGKLPQNRKKWLSVLERELESRTAKSPPAADSD